MDQNKNNLGKNQGAKKEELVKIKGSGLRSGQISFDMAVHAVILGEGIRAGRIRPENLENGRPGFRLPKTGSG